MVSIFPTWVEDLKQGVNNTRQSKNKPSIEDAISYFSTASSHVGEGDLGTRKGWKKGLYKDTSKQDSVSYKFKENK